MSNKPPSLIARLTVLCISVAVLLWTLQLLLALVATVWWQLLAVTGVLAAVAVVIITWRNRWR